MIIQTFPSGPFVTNAYVVVSNGIAAIIDPAPESGDAITSFINEKNLKVDKILITHSHWDHIADGAALKKNYNTTVYAHKEDTGNLEKPGSDGLPLMFPFEPLIPDVLVDDGDTISIGESKFIVIHTPGHSPGSICYYCEKEGVLFTGDTLFQGAIGNLELPTSNPPLMWPSLEKIHNLPPQTKVYPGHGPSTTLAQETWIPQAKELFGY